MGLTLLAAMETAVRNDLKDVDPANYLWTTAEVDRHIQHAVNDYQRVLPLLATTVITVVESGTPPLTWRQVLSPLPTGYLWTDRVEYPVDVEPPSYRLFREEIPGGGSLLFSTGDPPLAGDPLKVMYAMVHTLSPVASTIPQEHEELIALGAVSYAARSGTRYAIGRLNASIWTPRGLAAFATETMKNYQAWLERVREDYSASGAPMVSWGNYPSDWWRV